MDMSFTEWLSALGHVVLVVVISFVVLSALTSVIRFQMMSEQALEKEELGTSEERDFRLIIVNQIALARRAQKPISVVLLQFPDDGVTTSEAETFIKPVLRATDMVLSCGDRRVGLLLLCGSDKAEVPLRRVMGEVNKAQLAGADQWKFGVAGYPEHGFKTSVLYERALEMTRTAEANGDLVAGMAPGEEVKDGAVKIPAGSLDNLTGLISEDKMLGIMRRFIAQERRKDLPVSMVYMEIDQPERIFDQYGKAEVDQMLKELAAYLDKNVRETDIIARMGETGFVMVHSAKPAASMILAQRIGEHVRRVAFKAGNGMKISLSAGVAGYPDVMGTVVQYFVSAESALQVARLRGRNQCVRFDQNLQLPADDESSVERI